MKPSESIRELFLAARSLPLERRTPFLDRACGGDGEMRREIESLLDHDAADDEPSPLHASLGWLGGYRLLSSLGEGGMGVVYHAEQDAPRRIVALKVVRPEMVTPVFLRRMEFEAEALGRLQHPGIARIYEAGFFETAAGRRPFLAMELVEGRPLDAYAASSRISTRARVALVLDVCDAVQHAHQRGVIHRDLKPANILVDDQGRSKVVDFGIARLADHGPSAALTRSGQILGTLPYMSPEQVEGGVDLDTRTDVYSLGVIGYELLAGHLPVEVAGATVTEAARRIVDQDPRLLGSVDRRLAGDLETIFAKALEKDRERRYASAAELALDLRRYLQDEPIHARLRSAFYVWSRFARRHRALVFGVAATIVALVAGVIGTSVQTARARSAERAAVGEAARAREAEAAARRDLEINRAVVGFFQSMLLSMNPEVLGREVKVADVLEWAAVRTRTALAHQPMVASLLQSTIGAVLNSHGRHRDALPLLEEAHRAIAAGAGEDHPSTLFAAGHLVEVYRNLRRLEDAESLARRTTELLLRSRGEKDRETLIAMNELVSCLQEQDKLREAAPWTDRAAAIGQTLPADDPNRLWAESNDAMLRLRQGRLAEAVELYEPHYERVCEVNGEEHPETLNTGSSLASALYQLGRLEEAEALCRRVLVARQRVLGPDHRKTMSTESVLASILSASDRIEEAERVVARILDAQQRTLGENHQDRLHVLLQHADLAFARGDGEEAVRRARMAEAAHRTALGDDHPRALEAGAALASYLANADRPLEALEVAMRACSGLRLAYGDEHPMAIYALQVLGDVYYRLERYEECTLQHRLAVDACRRTHGNDQPATQQALLLLAAGLEPYALDDSIAVTEQVIESMQHTHGTDQAALLMLKIDLQRRRARAGRCDARRELERLAKTAAAQLGEDCEPAQYARDLLARPP